MLRFPPRSLDDIVGHDAAVAAIRRRFAAGNHEVPLLLYGPDGVGKATLSRLYAKAILCQEPRDDAALPCGRCKFCRSFDDDLGFAFAEFDACDVKKPRRTFRAKLTKTSLVDHRVFVIRGIDDATPEFVDALLKSMEEGENTTFILLADDLQSVRAAGQSRCMVQRVRPLSGADMKAFCENVLQSIGCQMPSAEIVEVILAGSRGLPSVAARACLSFKGRDDIDVKAVSAMLEVDWGEEAIKYCLSLFDIHDAGNSETFFGRGIDCGVATARIRRVLSELAQYVAENQGPQTSWGSFKVLRQDLMVQLATRFRERSTYAGQSPSAMWTSIADLFLQEDYGDPIGFEFATQTARALLRVNNITEADILHR